jgi:penicillin-binding protein 1A
MTAEMVHPQLSHPMSNIGDDFIARALADEPVPDRDAMTSDESIERARGLASFGAGDR